MKTRRKIEESEAEMALGIITEDNFLFSMLFMRKELSMEPTIPQKCMLCDYTRKTLLCTSRNVGKTVSIRGRLLRDIATFLPTHMNDGITRNEEILLVTPAQAHLSPLIDKLFADIDQVPFFKSIVTNKRGGDMPEIITKTGLTIFGRIEGLGGDDRNMQGLHPIKIYGDELQFGNCIAGYSAIPVASGGFKRMEDVEEGDVVFGYNGESVEQSVVLGKRYSGTRDTYRISTRTRSVVATDEHPFLVAVKTKSGKRGVASKSSSEWELQWKPLKEIRPKDKIIISRGEQFNKDYSIGESMAYLVGLFLGDGNYGYMHLRDGSKNGHLSGISISTPIGDKARDLSIAVLNDLSANGVCQYKNTVCANDTVLAHILRDEIGVFGDATVKKIPDICFSLPDNETDALITGLFMTDGYHRKNGDWAFEVASKDLAEGFRILLCSRGWRVSNVYHQKGKNPFWKKTGKGVEIVESWTFIARQLNGSKREKDYKNVTPRGISRIYIPDELALDSVTRIEHCGEQDTYDIETSTHNFIADGVLVHNSRNHRSRVGGAMPETEWLYAGVPNGLRGSIFFNLDQTKEGKSWSRHKFSMLTANPRFLASRRYRREVELSFGGKSSSDYASQVLGQWGEVTTSSFPPGSVSWNAEIKYYTFNGTSVAVNEALQNNTLPSLLKIPQVLCYRAAIGYDAGFSPDPATFMLVVQYAEGEPWHTYARVSLYGVMLPRQLEILKFLWVYVLAGKCAMLSVDSPEIYQLLLSDENKFIFNGRITFTNQGGTSEWDMLTGKVAIDKDDKVDAEFLEHRKDNKTRKVRRKQFLTDLFKTYMSNYIMGSATATRLVLGIDTELENELMQTLERKTESNYIVYDVAKKGKMNLDQILDSLRGACDAIIRIEQSGISDEFGLEEMLEAMGWSRKAGDEKWEGNWLG